MVFQKKLRDIAWETGHRYPVRHSTDYIALSMVHPHLGHLHWHVREESAVAASKDDKFSKARLIIRVYDVTDLLFDGFNSHMFFDIEMGQLEGNYYFHVHHHGRDYMAETGLINREGEFRSFSRSKTVYFDHDRPSGNYHTGGLFVGGAINRTFPVENIFDAPVYEKMNREMNGLKRTEDLSVAMVFLDINPEAGVRSGLGTYIEDVSGSIANFWGDMRLFAPLIWESGDEPYTSIMSNILTISAKLNEELLNAYRERPFHILHCHEWYSLMAGLDTVNELDIPMVLSLHSTEYARAQGNINSRISSVICEWERRGIEKACLIIVPDSSARHHVINLYGASPEEVVTIPDVFKEGPPDSPHSSSDVRQWFGIDQHEAIVLFAGEMSHAAGADLLMEALPTVCRNKGSAQFVFAGDGPLRGELESRSFHSGVSHRCRFVGDVSGEVFESLLYASDFVVIPARTWQGEGLAHKAINCGKPVLATHQSGIMCVVHGENGLVTFDNPGSIVWGVQEMLSNALQGSMVRHAAKRKAGGIASIESVAAQHYMYYEILLKRGAGVAYG